MATITFRSNEGFGLASSGVGFYGSAGFGASVRVGEYQHRTYATNSAGTQEGLEIDNIKFTHNNSGIIGPGASGVSSNLLRIPNYQTTLNIRLNHDSAVKTQNGVVQIYDRVNTTKAPSGVTCRIAEVVHPSTLQSVTGSGSSTWVDASGNVSTLSIISSPGTNGQRPNGANTSDTQHDWYLALSASPKSVGSKTQFGLYVSLEYF